MSDYVPEFGSSPIDSDNEYLSDGSEEEIVENSSEGHVDTSTCVDEEPIWTDYEGRHLSFDFIGIYRLSPLNCIFFLHFIFISFLLISRI